MTESLSVQSRLATLRAQLHWAGGPEALYQFAEQLVAERDAQTNQLNAAVAQIAQLAEEAGRQGASAAALRSAAVHALRAIDLTHDEDRLREHLTSALADDAGATLLAELAELRASCDALREVVRVATLQIGAGDVPLPVAIAQLRVEAHSARRLADAVELFHAAGRAAEAGVDSAPQVDLAAASYRLGAALADYRKAQRAGTQTTTTPEEAGRQVKQAVDIAQRFGELFGDKGASDATDQS